MELLPNEAKNKLPTTTLIVSVAEIDQDIPKYRVNDAEKWSLTLARLSPVGQSAGTILKTLLVFCA